MHCKYGETLPEMLQDKLVCGVNHSKIQNRLLAEKNLTYEKAIDLAQSIEAAEKDTRKLNSSQKGNTTPQPH